ncbi:response regulator transcription factor [Streptomyces acidiscabies]|uniref:Response regulator transcription factor n=1 Tax=Streptomyces acidiscabies TaxID=42234 RepID=A0AAP6BC65_9ACTN|nr:response regulator transcription factor [Streptomyces acidiscabies]MBP5942692.1 response regulator transcription factor [Streptomyces sp. LBUM 1476]MBZ3917971.1 response regulator transcription factor [Streptomyces acidiscabies]MDX2961945.1 response regulator transcription factor [Streptomyces acidiscabies]MDX3021829.1 response regulator transcription factor [Streptomyces acidiscabies]MDX3789486.1 response regulator transcription factor [Streptomyces acidiscabies]
MSDAQVPAHRLLVVEDDPGIRMLLESALRLSGYEVLGAATGREALRTVDESHPDLVLLDIMLPDLDGIEVTRGLRASGVRTPVLFLTARGELADRIAGLSAGGDDYVPKPFSIEEVLLRIRAILRRTSPGSPDGAGAGVLRFADLELDENAHEVHRAGEYVPLSPTEFNLLVYLMENTGRVLSKNKILNQVWGYDFAGDGRIVETYIKYLRRKIDRFDPPLLHTVRGVGYCLRLPQGRG